MAQITRLGVSGIPRHLYASFAGKEAMSSTGDLAANHSGYTAAFFGDVFRYQITDTDILQLPINAQLADRPDPRAKILHVVNLRGTAGAQRSAGRIPRGRVQQLTRERSTFTVTSNSKGHE